MSQLTFKFPFKANYFEEDFYVSTNNFSAYKLIESWPKWSSRYVNIFGPAGCGKTHLANIFKKKINSFFIKASELTDGSLALIKSKECLIIDDFKNNIEEKLFYSVLNQSYQSNQYVIVNSLESIKNSEVILSDLKSRFDNFIDIGIDLPTDDLIRVILSKNFSDKQVKVESKLLEYILKNINRSYEDISDLINKVDFLSLSTGKSININLIKKVLKK
ncbi:MAG: Chromosomal replication initiation ATPase DnaA [Pelagibacterales bacterium]|nr:Chromosomal replication initiation ATPase DnaA [Pelagibacterales bacterium]|tara:strand:- start:3645 stop:4298 length:654 start_codon:yes stop_codon:yes gene_type:complete